MCGHKVSFLPGCRAYQVHSVELLITRDRCVADEEGWVCSRSGRSAGLTLGVPPPACHWAPRPLWSPPCKNRPVCEGDGYGEDQGGEPHRRTRRRRDDPHHVELHQEQADPALSRYR